jgi:hypothetical protein
MFLVVVKATLCTFKNIHVKLIVLKHKLNDVVPAGLEIENKICPGGRVYLQEFKVSKNIFQNQENLQIVTNLALSTS